jgi:uncharacterized protein (DUF2384 family)
MQTSKYKILDILAKKLNAYHATQWLKTSNPKLDNQTPADIISKGGNCEKVFKILLEDISKK